MGKLLKRDNTNHSYEKGNRVYTVHLAATERITRATINNSMLISLTT